MIGAGYGAAAGRGYGKAADLGALRQMSRQTAHKIKAWCRVLYVDSGLAMAIGIVGNRPTKYTFNTKGMSMN